MNQLPEKGDLILLTKINDLKSNLEVGSICKIHWATSLAAYGHPNTYALWVIYLNKETQKFVENLLFSPIDFEFILVKDKDFVNKMESSLPLNEDVLPPLNESVMEL